MRIMIVVAAAVIIAVIGVVRFANHRLLTWSDGLSAA
jgi:hypothetical protein